MRTVSRISSLATVVAALFALGACGDAPTSAAPPQDAAVESFSALATCGDPAGCRTLGGAYISHYTGSNCTGIESYYTAYFNYDGIRRSWDGNGLAGNTLYTITNVSYRDSSGTCYNAWPSGNTLTNFVLIYR